MRPLAFSLAAAILCVAPSLAPAQTYGGDTTSLIDYWYRTYLGRPTDAIGINYWTARIQQAASPDAPLAGILASDEYYIRSGQTPEGFISNLYNNLLRRPPSGPELDFWVRRMYTESREDVADELLRQNPGTWVGANVNVQPVVPTVTIRPGVVVIDPDRRPRVEIDRDRHWERDRHEDWNQHHEIHDYHRPDYPYNRH